MKRKTWALGSVVVLAAVVAWAGTQATETQAPPSPAAKEAPKKEPVFWPKASIKWKDETAPPGSRTAVLWGDPATGGYGMLNRWAAGTEVPLHWHTFDFRGLMLEGTLVVTPEGGTAQELGPGSYAYVPGKMRHTTTCKAGADCVFFATSNLRSEIRFPGEKKARP